MTATAFGEGIRAQSRTMDGMPLMRELRVTLRHFFQAVLFGALSFGARSQESVPSTGALPPAQALATFVAKPDDSFAWRIQRRYLHDDAEVVELHLESQVWQNQLWKHQLLLVRPHRVKDERHAVFVVGGGRWREEYETATAATSLPEDGELFVAIARLLRAPVVVLGQVPYQPQFGLTEDRLIAHSFERYLATSDGDWPLLLPMVKSVVRAFDASSAASQQEWRAPLERFTVLGGSKRGWTTWLTAAVDSRVVALAPIVIDALNMERHFPHQTEAWGAPSEQIRPYTELGLDRVLASPEGAALREIVDPFSYRANLLAPKLVILATNDEYFPLDSANLYFSELREPKYLLYLPNERHSIDKYEPVVRSLRALHEAARGGDPLPRLEWEYRLEDGAMMLCIRSEPPARELRVWAAMSADRDLRDAQWYPIASSRGSEARFRMLEPDEGYAAVVGEAAFGVGRRAFTLSTSLAVVAAPASPRYGTEPPSVPGLCEALGSSALVPAR
jgi:PhoPQ-activated pathogenicity-related protein